LLIMCTLGMPGGGVRAGGASGGGTPEEVTKTAGLTGLIHADPWHTKPHGTQNANGQDYESVSAQELESAT
jgi:hypothetical protein